MGDHEKKEKVEEHHPQDEHYQDGEEGVIAQQEPLEGENERESSVTDVKEESSQPADDIVAENKINRDHNSESINNTSGRLMELKQNFIRNIVICSSVRCINTEQVTLFADEYP